MGSGTHEEPTETLHLRTPRGAVQPAFRLTVVEGPDAPATYLVDGRGDGRVLLGTGPTCQWVLTDRAVSRRHAALVLRDGGVALEDLDSTNGTFVGALRVREVLLTGGEDIALASTRLRVERLTEGASVAVARTASFGRLIGASVAMRRLYPTLARLATLDVPMLVEGEAGTGKELLAEVLHEEGPRRERELVVFDARRVAPERVEALLFGAAGQPGAVEECQGGTLVVDEPSELPADVQQKLARLLEGRSLVRADGSSLALAGTRVIALSRSDVEREVQAGHLREELATLLGAARVELPPLRDRAGDVTLLATTFFRALALEDRFLLPLTTRRFEAYAWPGNVRELKAATIRVATTGDDATDARSALRAEEGETSPSELYRRVLAADLALPRAREIITEDFDRRFVRRILERHGGNVTRAAAASGLARRYFQVLRVKRGV